MVNLTRNGRILAQSIPIKWRQQNFSAYCHDQGITILQMDSIRGNKEVKFIPGFAWENFSTNALVKMCENELARMEI